MTLDKTLEFPLAYFITFTCYGTWLHGVAAGSVDPNHKLVGTPTLSPNAARERSSRQRSGQPPYALDQPRRLVVLETLIEICRHRGYALLAAHVRTKHVHLVLQAAVKPEPTLNTLKSYSSRRLNERGFDTPERIRWTRHGSTRYLRKVKDVQDAIHYVLHEQGTPMQVYDPAQSEPRV